MDMLHRSPKAQRLLGQKAHELRGPQRSLKRQPLSQQGARPEAERQKRPRRPDAGLLH